MSGGPGEALTPAEAQVSAVLGELRGDQPVAANLGPSVVRTVRWQRPLRQVAAGLGLAAGGLAAGMGDLLRGWMSR